MTFTPENIFFLGAVLIFASIVISKWGYRFGVPTLLLFLFTGMLFGSDGLGLEFHSHEDAQLIGMLSLSVILFSGGMDTKRRDIEPVATQGLMLSTVGVLITTGITWLLQIVMFLTLGLLVNPKEMLNVMLVAVSIGLFMMFVARPIAVFLCLQPFRVPFKAPPSRLLPTGWDWQQRKRRFATILASNCPMNWSLNSRN